MASTTPHNVNRPNAPTNSPTTITIWQQNINKSGTCQHNLISSTVLVRKGIDLIALQEPAINTFSTTITSRDWIPVYPTTHRKEPHKTRSLFLIRSNILTEQWKQIDFPSGDITMVQLSSRWGTALILNIYNDCKKNNTIHQLEAFTQANCNLNNKNINSNGTETRATIWLGDFNRHHLH
jgi:hypothetical protein